MARNKFPEETINLILEQALKLFLEKGYEHTTIQDIINNLGGLSKGAIYHHFKSKEEIFKAVSKKIDDESTNFHVKIRDDTSKNGYEKLKNMINSGYRNPNNAAYFALSKEIMRDPRFMMNQITQIYDTVAPQFLEPIIQQGIADGSIKTAYPKELAEVIITLMNVWISPAIAKTTPEDMRTKLVFFGSLLRGIGLDIVDDDAIEQYIKCYSAFIQQK